MCSPGSNCENGSAGQCSPSLQWVHVRVGAIGVLVTAAQGHFNVAVVVTAAQGHFQHDISDTCIRLQIFSCFIFVAAHFGHDRKGIYPL